LASAIEAVRACGDGTRQYALPSRALYEFSSEVKERLRAT